MKKVINGALYNTDTAKQLADWDNKLPGNDFGYCSETLYRTKAGKFFLHCEGGANSIYGEWHGNSGGFGEQINPLSAEQARHWAEQKLDGDQYAEIFGEPDEAADSRNTTFNLSIPADLLDQMREIKGKGQSLSAVICDGAKSFYRLGKRQPGKLSDYIDSALKFANDTADWGSLDQYKMYVTTSDGWKETCDNAGDGIDVSWAFHMSPADILRQAPMRYLECIRDEMQAAIDNDCDCEQFQTVVDKFF